LKLVMGNKSCTLRKIRKTRKYTYIVLDVNWVYITNDSHTHHGFWKAAQTML
jgi:hypothetical protein